MKTLIAIAVAANARIEWIATGNGPMHEGVPPEETLVQIPRLDVQAGAGGGRFAVDEAAAETIAVGRNWLREMGIRPSDARLMWAQGTSMEPTVDDGAPIIVDLGATDLVDGRVYVCSVEGELFLKRLRRGRAGIVMSSDNPLFPDEPIDRAENFRIVGRVRWSGKRL